MMSLGVFSNAPIEFLVFPDQRTADFDQRKEAGVSIPSREEGRLTWKGQIQ